MPVGAPYPEIGEDIMSNSVRMPNPRTLLDVIRMAEAVDAEFEEFDAPHPHRLAFPATSRPERATGHCISPNEPEPDLSSTPSTTSQLQLATDHCPLATKRSDPLATAASEPLAIKRSEQS